MRKLFIYPQWNFEKAEEFLDSMEKQGWILRKISHSYFFHFERKKSPPRSVKYLYTYNQSHTDVGMDPLREHFERTYFANSVSCGKYKIEAFYRIVDMQEDLKPIREWQIAYMKRVYFIRLLIALVFLAPNVLHWIGYDTNVVMSAILNIWGVGVGVYILNCITGLAFLFRKP